MSFHWHFLFFSSLAMKKILRTFLFIVAIYFISCSPGNEKRGEQIDLSRIDIEPVNIRRYGKALFSIDEDSLAPALKKLQPEFPVILNADLDDTLNIIQLHDFITDPLNQRLYDSVMVRFPDLSAYEDQFTDAFKRFRYYFPDKEIPEVYTYVSGLVFENPVQFINGEMIIALDMYLDEEMEIYRRLGLPLYRIKRMNENHVVRDGVYELYYYHFLKRPGDNVLQKMISTGKHLYFLDALIPETPDHIKIGYPQEKLQWCNENESNIWAFLIENELMYASDAYTLRKFFTDGPFTSQFSRESPARIGEWLGWQIIRAFMKNNPGTSLEEMLAMEDAQLILKKSGYKPRR